MNSIIIFCAQYLFLFVIAAILVALYLEKKENRLRFFATIILAGIIAFILSRIAGKLYYDPRPFVREHVKPLIKHIADNGFPSDHALLTGTLTAVAYFFNKKVFVVMLVLSVLVALGRVLSKLHSPLDIAGGWIFGIIGALASYYLVRWYLSRNKANS